MTRYENVARMARDEARARRRVLIVTRTAYQAAQIMTALEDALRPRDGETRLLNGKGLWSARSTSWGGGCIDVRVAGPAVRGRTADTLLLDEDLTAYRRAEALPVVLGVIGRVVVTW